MQIPRGRLPEKRELTEVSPLYGLVTDKEGFEYFYWNGMHGTGELWKVDLAVSGKRFLEKCIVSQYQYESPDIPNAFWVQTAKYRLSQRTVLSAFGYRMSGGRDNVM